ncbi:uncharacterized protein LOC106636931 [Copidosoma floridanum]|uniref:uncharacterized protein LOC106636931 n=1 Tax=Copidosoma floridanum TaxID=29053 RepID=UPI0006C9C559|nr:uncharacterized protein LOC106636931 [Copidosoma floridanum]
MTEIDFYDDNVDVNRQCCVSMMNDENYTTQFLQIEDYNVANEEINQWLDCAPTAPMDKGFVKLFLQVDVKMNSTMVNMTNLLYRAIELENEENVQLLLDYGAKVDIKDIFGKTPLHCTASPGCQDRRKMSRIAKLLLDKSSDPKSLLNECTNAGETALHWAVTSNKKELIKLYLQYGANVNAKRRDGKTSLYISVEHKNVDAAALLLKNQAKVNERTICGTTALHEAVKQKAERMARLLLNHGAKANARDMDGKTPLHLAAELNYLDEATMDKIVKLLLNNGAEVNDRANSGETAFHCAIVDGNERLVRLFLDHGARVNSTDFDGKSCLHFAIRHSNRSIVKLLLDRGAEIGARTDEGLTALHVAVVVEDENMVKVLLEYEADVNATDENGRTPLSLAFEVAHMRSIYNPWNGFYPINSQAGCDDNIFELLIKHIAMLGQVCEENFRVMSGNEKLTVFYRRCQTEMGRMREAKVCDNISMHGVLTRDINTGLVGYARNENLSRVFESGVCELDFPIYYRVLRDRFYKADHRRRMLEPSAVNLALLVRPIVMPELVVNKILAYLRTEDLVNLGTTW